MTILEKIDALEPAHRDQLIQLSFDNLSDISEEAVKVLVDKELITASKDFTGIHPTVHMAVCQWCADNTKEEDPE